MSGAVQRKFREDGYPVLPNFKTHAEKSAVGSGTEKIVGNYDPADNMSVFTTNERERCVDDYFMDSAGKARCLSVYSTRNGLRRDSGWPMPEFV